MINLNSLIIRNQEISSQQRDCIIALKNCYWKYPYESQIQWMEKNFHDDDCHIMLYCGDNLVAYLGLVNVKIDIDGKKIDALGVGNVCTVPRQTRKGIGRECVKQANKIIEDANKLGLLLCHEPLIGFYEKCGWKKINLHGTNVVVAGIPYIDYLMLYNHSGKIKANTISIDRIF